MPSLYPRNLLLFFPFFLPFSNTCAPTYEQYSTKGLIKDLMPMDVSFLHDAAAPGSWCRGAFSWTGWEHAEANCAIVRVNVCLSSLPMLSSCPVDRLPGAWPFLYKIINSDFTISTLPYDDMERSLLLLGSSVGLEALSKSRRGATYGERDTCIGFPINRVYHVMANDDCI